MCSFVTALSCICIVMLILLVCTWNVLYLMEVKGYCIVHFCSAMHSYNDPLSTRDTHLLCKLMYFLFE